MMKLIGSNPWRGSGVCRVFRAVFYSAEARPSSSPPNDSLLQRILGVGDQKTSMVPLLDRWIEEGRETKHSELLRIVKQLRRYRRYSHALQVQEFLTDRMNYDLTAGDIAVRLDLISKVHGLNKAEKYFNTIPFASRLDNVHGAMLNCYAEKKSLKKADELFQKMKELGFVKSALTYNVMLTLYSRMENHDKLDILIQEMGENGIKDDTYTFNIRLNAYASSDIERMEKLLTEAEADSQKTVDSLGFFLALEYLWI